MGSSLLNKQLCSYMVLLRMGFTLPALSPKLRCALTAPFHPYLIAIRRFVFCGTFPKVALAGRYPASWSHGARTFLSPETRPAAIRLSASVKWQILHHLSNFSVLAGLSRALSWMLFQHSALVKQVFNQVECAEQLYQKIENDYRNNCQFCFGKQA